jgi:cobalt/nickel transport system permease protein
MSRNKIIAASIAGCVLTLQLGAFSVTAETLLSGITALPWKKFVMLMQPIHLAIGFVEGLITAAVLVFVYEARPELLYDGNAFETDGRFSFGKTMGILAAAAVVIGGIVSLFASSNPDGLEWSIANITGSTELEASGAIYSIAAAIQDKLALLPDYSLKGAGEATGTAFSGIVGGMIVLIVCVAACYLFKFFRKQKRV